MIDATTDTRLKGAPKGVRRGEFARRFRMVEKSAAYRAALEREDYGECICILYQTRGFFSNANSVDHFIAERMGKHQFFDWWYETYSEPLVPVHHAQR